MVLPWVLTVPHTPEYCARLVQHVPAGWGWLGGAQPLPMPSPPRRDREAGGRRASARQPRCAPGYSQYPVLLSTVAAADRGSASERARRNAAERERAEQQHEWLTAALRYASARCAKLRWGPQRGRVGLASTHFGSGPEGSDSRSGIGYRRNAETICAAAAAARRACACDGRCAHASVRTCSCVRAVHARVRAQKAGRTAASPTCLQPERRVAVVPEQERAEDERHAIHLAGQRVATQDNALQRRTTGAHADNRRQLHKTYACTHTSPHTCTRCVYERARAHARTHARAHTRTHTHTRTHAQMGLRLRLPARAARRPGR